MHDPYTNLAGFRIWRIRVSLEHKDPCRDGDDDSCYRSMMRFPYEESERFVRACRRAYVRQWLHLRHLRVWIGWNKRWTVNQEGYLVPR